MSDPVESGQSVPESVAATAPPSEQPGVSQNNSQAGSFDADAFKADLLKEVSAMVQSTKDKRIADLEKGQQAHEDRLDRYAAYLEQGLTHDQAKRELAIDDVLLNRDPQPISEPVSPSNLTVEDAKKAASSLLADVDENTRNTVLSSVSGLVFQNQEALNKYVVREIARTASQPKPNPGTVPGPSGSTPPPPNVQELADKYQQEMLAARGKGYAVGDAIKQKYREMGVPVDDILFEV